MSSTPGPWTHLPNIGVMNCNGREIARTIVADAYEKADYEEAWANARLIATVPELLAACKEVFRIAADNAELFQRYGNEADASVYLLIVDVLRGALVKAIGRDILPPWANEEEDPEAQGR